MQASKRYSHGEVAAATRHTLDSDRTIVKLGKLLHQGQPNAAALVGAAFLPVDAMETLKNAQRIMFGMPTPLSWIESAT